MMKMKMMLTTMMRMRAIVYCSLVAVAACGFTRPAGAQTTQPATPQATQQAAAGVVDDFAARVDLRRLGEVAVHTEGRVKSLDSFCRSAMQFVSGSHLINRQSPTYTYLDLMWRPEAYFNADVVYVKNKLLRSEIAQTLRANKSGAAMAFDAGREASFIGSGLIAPTLLAQPAVLRLLADRSRNVMTTAKFVDAIDNAMGMMQPDALRANLKLIAPPGGSISDPWTTMEAFLHKDHSGHAETHPESQHVDPALREQIRIQWGALERGWKDGDAAIVNTAAAQLAELLPKLNPEVYPQANRLAWESWYFRSYNMTWVWVFFALAMVPLLVGIVFRWRGAYWVGLALFVIALAAQTFAVMLRWYVSQRWPNSNMFEAITTAAWFGGCLALILEVIVRRKPMRGLFALGSAVASMTAMMAVKMFPLELNAGISNMMPVLNDLWLYIHTNVIIFSYCLIFIAAVTAAIYLAHRAIMFVRGRDGVAEYARVGGAGSLILTRPDGSSYIEEGKSTFGQVLDGTTMVVMEMSFVLLWAGIVMGAIWADHSWGRPWGWDPKEVFALNTFLVFLVLVHGRLKVKDKGLWTAIMALAGAAVMLFNWIIINFAISGLHSYA